MDSARRLQIERLYHAALACSAAERPALLAEACAGDEGLRREVEARLNARATTEDIFAAPAIAAAGMVSKPDISPLAGRRVGVYEVRECIGAGGMGEVYRARDTRLGRDVAVKILPRAFTDDPDRLARFEREARVLAALNHPNIATIHGIEEADGIRALVMELVEGETLAERIARGRMPVAEALALAHQIAGALDDAHEKGIIHRDLKPANIKITPAGAVKVLDFGLAKVAVGDGAASRAPTVTAVGTREGTIMGTAAYMSPEQARGLALDKRTDIWAFGCVLYEMLTGRAAFAAATISDTIAAILDREPDWTALPGSTPTKIRGLLRRCLHKDLKRRLRDAGDVVIQIVDDVQGTAIEADTPPAPWGAAIRLPALLAGTLVLGAAIGGASVWIARSGLSRSDARIVQFVATSGDADALEPSGLDRDVAVSPDGTRLVYLTGGPGRVRLVTRPLAGLDVTVLVDGGPRAPFFSPDGRWVGFYEVFGSLRRISTTGGPVVEISRSVGGAGRGASWSSDGTIVFATTDPGTGLWRVSAAGGEPNVLTRPDAASGELDHFWPEILPGGNAVLFTIVSAGSIDSAQVAVLDLNTGSSKVLVRGATHAQYMPTGHLVYGNANGLHAVPFDINRLAVTGEAIKVLDDVAITPEGAVNAAVAQDGTLVYVRASAQGLRRVLVWVNRDGREESVAAPPRPYIYPRLSPDGTRVAVEVWDEERDIWVWDLVRETLTRVTENSGRDGFPVWTANGRRLIFGSAQHASTNLFSRAADGTGSVERLTEGGKIQFPYSISPDGARLVLREDDPDTGLDISVVSLEGKGRATPLIHTAFNEQNGEVSPDGRWLAYQSNESGQDEIYVRPFPLVADARWQVSTTGGTRPAWARDGRELFYLASDGLTSVTVDAGPAFVAGRPTRLLERRYFAETAFIGRTYDVAPDGRRFLMIRMSDEAAQPRIVVVQNWLEELKRLVQTN